MFSFSSASLNHIASISSFPTPQFSITSGICIPNIQINNMISSMTDMNRFIMPLPNITQIMLPKIDVALTQPKLDISHCTPVFNQGEGPPFLYEFNKSDPTKLNTLKSYHNALNEAAFSTEEPLHPLMYPAVSKIMDNTKKEIDNFCK